MAKGGRFEGEVCKQLSLWWSGGEDDNVFGRSHGSGGRGTARAKKGKRAANQHGDVMAVDESGHALIRFVCLELKRGYNGLSLQDLLDAKTFAKDGKNWPAWLAQAERSRAACDAKHWAVICRRDKRTALVAAPPQFFWDVIGQATMLKLPAVHVMTDALDVTAITLDDFFRHARVDNVRGNCVGKPKRGER